MPLTGLCIELRPNLRSGVVFLQFDHNIADRNETRLVIREHDVYIAAKSQGSASSRASSSSTSSSSDSDSEADEEKDDAAEVESLVIRHDCFGMDIGCISLFVVTGNHISFRFNYTQIDLEALDGGAVQVAMAPLLLSCRENEPISVICRDCRATLVEERSYRRLREFPSCVVDPSEFFCHNHGGCEGAGESKVPSLTSLAPGATDLFYGLNYVVVSMNRDQSPSILNRDDHLYCKRCMRYLGAAIFNGAAGRLWADAVCWLPGKEGPGGGGGGGATAALPRHFFRSSSMTQLVKRLLYSLWPQPLPQLCLSTSRAVLVTSLPSRRRHQYMFIHVVESQLRVLRRIQPDSQELRCYRACKLYYGVFEEQEQEPPLLQHWQAQQSVPQMEISPGMFQTLQERFELNNQLIPQAWRQNSASEGLQLSYFFYEDEPQPEGVVLSATDYVDYAATGLGKMQLDDQYETDAGHASSESESDDEHSDSDEDEDASAGRSTIKRCPTPPRHCLHLSTSSSSASSEDK
ncbi:hypothetical protein KR054_004046 [Drosophila jambulina]|nr:hypothetical protein KR054_004046 [Drosophila jambulina]